jgi:molecular chaperone GrpE
MKNMSKNTQKPPDQADIDSDEVTFEELTDDGSDTLSSQTKLKELREKLKRCQMERDEYLAQLQRERADAVNLRREEEQKRIQMKTYMVSRITLDLIPALDSFDAAMRSETWNTVDTNWRIGVEYIYQQLLKALSDNGVESYESKGDHYNSEIHEIHEEVVSDLALAGKVIGTVQKGYKQGESVIRPEKIIIGKVE